MAKDILYTEYVFPREQFVGVVLEHLEVFKVDVDEREVVAAARIVTAKETTLHIAHLVKRDFPYPASPNCCLNSGPCSSSSLRTLLALLGKSANDCAAEYLVRAHPGGQEQRAPPGSNRWGLFSGCWSGG